MVEGLDSDDEGDQRGNAESEPPQPPAAPAPGGEPVVSVDQEPGVDVGDEVVGWLVARLLEAIPVARAASGEHKVHRVSVRIVADDSMSEAHRRWCDIDGTTDVLTFHAPEPDGLHIDLMICIDEAKRRAAEFGHEFRRELLLYSVHGLLHCLGHDDHDPESFNRMHAEEDRVLREIGVGPVFRPEAAS